MNNLINISEGTSLAIHGLGLLAETAPERLSVKIAAENLRASEAHLAKVFVKLQKKGWVASSRGPSGGYSLSASPDDISFLDVYELFEATVDTEGCPMGRKHCPFGSCMFDGRIHKVNMEIYKILKNTTITDLSSSIEGTRKIEE